MKLIAGMVMGVIVAILVTGCSNDELFGFEDKDKYKEDSLLHIGFASFVDYADSNYLSIDVTQKHYSKSEYQIIAKAVSRLAIFDNSGIIKIKKGNSNSFNISDSLYDICIKMISHTNGIIMTSKQNNSIRVKNRCPEFCFVWGDCAPKAMTHVLRGNIPTLEEAYSYCDLFQSNWRTIGLYRSNAVAILNQYISPVNVYQGGVISHQSRYLENCLLLLSGDPGHAVNATYYVTGDPDVIFYYDYWSNVYGDIGIVQAQDTESINAILTWR